MNAMKSITLRVPAHIKAEAVLVVMQTAVGHLAAALAQSRRNASRNGFNSEALTDVDLRAAIQYLQAATTQAITDLTAPAVIQASSTAICEVVSIGGSDDRR
jgi:hypothetical protein